MTPGAWIDRNAGFDPSELQLLEVHSEALGRWAEDPLVSLWCAKQDSLLRGIDLATALGDRLAGWERLTELDPIYTSAEVTVTVDGQVLPATEAAARTEQVLALLTAANPLGIEVDEEENLRRNAAMRTMLVDPLVSCGSSPDGEWEEPGFAVPFGPVALEGAQRFAQLAVYRVDERVVEVVQVVGRATGDLEAEFRAEPL